MISNILRIIILILFICNSASTKGSVEIIHKNTKSFNLRTPTINNNILWISPENLLEDSDIFYNNFYNITWLKPLYDRYSSNSWYGVNMGGVRINYTKSAMNFYPAMNFTSSNFVDQDYSYFPYRMRDLYLYSAYLNSNGDLVISQSKNNKLINISGRSYSKNIRIGRRFNGKILEIILNSSNTKASEINTYLHLKYGKTYSSNYIIDGRSLYNISSEYKHNIIGLGRWDKYNFLQRISTSSELIDSDGRITISTNNTYSCLNRDVHSAYGTPHGFTQPYFTTDKSFIIIASNGKNVENFVSEYDNSGHLYAKSELIWKVQRTSNYNLNTFGMYVRLNKAEYSDTSEQYYIFFDNDSSLRNGYRRSFPINMQFDSDGNPYFNISVRDEYLALNNADSYFYIGKKSTDRTISGAEKCMKPTATMKHPCKGMSNGEIKIDLTSQVSFDKPGKRQRIVTNQYLMDNLSQFTMEGWFRFKKSDYVSGKKYSFFGQDNVVEFGIYSTNKFHIWSETAGGVHFSHGLDRYPDDGAWHYIAIVGTGRQYKLYFDGVLVQTANHTPVSSYGHHNGSESTACIGGYVFDGSGMASNTFLGDLSKVGFWKVALSDDQVAKHYTEFKNYSDFDSGLIAGYNFFEGSGNTINPKGEMNTVGASFADGDSGRSLPYWHPADMIWSDGSRTRSLYNKPPGDYTLTVSLDGYIISTNSFTLKEIDMQIDSNNFRDEECLGNDYNFSVLLDSNSVSPAEENVFTYDFYINNIEQTGNKITNSRDLEKYFPKTKKINKLGNNNRVKVIVTDHNGCRVTYTNTIKAYNKTNSGVISIK
ncbi:MAG: LamG domain-containing protein [Marinifilaceae bacterium]|jgi:hypothetical protein|nr:LamG domain-containing protein [Marinifilaceae bacterium]